MATHSVQSCISHAKSVNDNCIHLPVVLYFLMDYCIHQFQRKGLTEMLQSVALTHTSSIAALSFL